MTTIARAVRVSTIRRLAGVAALLVTSLFAVTCAKDTVGPPPGATQLAFKIDPVNAMAATTIGSVVVEARDANGDPVTDFTGSVTLSIGTNPGSGALSGTTPVNAIGGLASFSDLSINKSGTGYKLLAVSSGLANANSGTFNITAGPASQISFTAQPGNTNAGGTMSPVKVRIEDAQGNVVDAFSGDISLAITSGSGAAGAALSGTTTQPTSAGVSTYSNLSIDKVGANYTFSATASGLPEATSSVFDITPGPAADLIITVQPSNATAGVDIAPAVVVTARDGLGNVATGFNGLVSLAITSGTGTAGATLSGIASQSATSGVTTFSVLSINKAGVGYTLSASALGVPTGAITAPFDIAVGPPELLNFTVQPSTVISGVPITPAVKVSVEDGSGNVVTGFGSNITVALFANPGGGALSGTTSKAPVNGVATFSDLSIDKSGIGYTLSVTATGLTGATSDPFNTLAGAGANLAFTVQPTSATAGAGVSPGIEVTLRDAQNNVATGFNGNVTLALGANPAGGTLAGTTTVAAVDGVATFFGLSIDKVGANYTLTATVTGIPVVTSAPFNIVPGAASQLVYSQQPHNAVAGAIIAPAVLLTALDAMGNVATGFNGLVTIAITGGTGTSGATLSGAIAVVAANGVATFGTLNINKSGTGYTLGASSTGLIGATSAGFDIAAGTAAQLAFTVPPTNAVAGSSIAPDVQVAALDILGNVATSFSGGITVGITSGTGTAGAVLSGTLTHSAINGVAPFSALSIDKAGTGYTLGATATGLSPATSTAFAVAVGSAFKLVFSVQPGNTTAGSVVAPGVEITAEDAGGNPVASFTGAVTVGIGANPGSGVLLGTTVANATAGVATFSNLSIAKSGTGYTLTASATGLVGGTSNTFNIVAGPATQLSFSVQPSAVAAGASIAPAVEVAALDLLGNIATSFTGTVTMAIGTNPSTATLTGTLAVAASAGIASFSNLKFDKAGVGYTLFASATGVTPATSGAFDVTIGIPTKLFISVQPAATDTAGSPLSAIQVLAQDAAGNTVPTFAGSVSIAIASGTGTTGAILSGTVTVGAAAGIATFANLSIDKAGTGYKLTATSFGLTAVTSTAFAIVPGALVKLGFTVQPVATKSGTAISPAVKVAGQDALGNTITTFNANVTVAIGVNAGTPTSGTLTGTLTVKASNGVSTFSTLKIDKVGVGYTLIASSGTLLGATSLPFNITPGNATQLIFSVPPLSTAAGATMIPAVKVTALDAAANVATTFTGNITVAIGTNAGVIPGTLSGTLIVKAVLGVSPFSTLKIDQAGNGYTLTASSAGLTGATSPAFDITNGSTLSFTVQPTAVNANAPITPPVKVTAKDNLGAVLTTFTGPVTVAIAAGTGTGGATLGGTKTVNAINGVATFSDLNIDVAGTGYKLTAASTGFSTGTSGAFTVNGIVAGPATKLGFITQPSSTPAGSIMIPGVVVAVQDVNGNTVTGLTGTITIALASNPAGGALSGTLTVPINAGKGSFPNLSIDKVGTYTMQATTSLGLTPTTSSAFTITTAATLHLVFTTQPASTTTAGQLISPPVQVAAQNASNVTVTSFTGPVTVAITAGTGANGAVLGGTTTVNAVNGVASFSNLSITKAGSGFKLTASAAGTAGANSASFTINPDVAVTLHWATQPTTTLANAVINGTTGGVTVDARDQFNNVVKTFIGNITVAISGGTSGAVLSGTKTVAAISGVAAFTNLSINLPGSGNFAYRLSATTTGLLSSTSAAFSVN